VLIVPERFVAPVTIRSVARKTKTKASPSKVDKRAVENDLGRRLRRHREQRGLSLRELARRLGISPSAISQFETGKSRLSVSRLYAIVSELGISLDELFSGIGAEQDGPEPPSTRAGRRGSGSDQVVEPDGRHVQRAGSRRAIDLESGVRWERLTAQADPEADFLYVVYDVGGSSSQGDSFIRHSGREYGLVLSGTLEVTVGFDAYELGPGDSISFDSTVPHCLRNVGAEPVHGVWFVIGRQHDLRAADLSATPTARSEAL
jgi:transcriptional regulator with XRE-family HTH domain